MRWGLDWVARARSNHEMKLIAEDIKSIKYQLDAKPINSACQLFSHWNHSMGFATTE